MTSPPPSGVIILDTTVLAELAGETPDAAVVAWADAVPAERLHITTVTVGELVFAVARLPGGDRRDELARRIDRLVDELFAGRVLAYDALAARTYGILAAVRERQGRPLAATEGQIAAIARARNASLATRNPAEFDGTGVPLIDPWASPAPGP